MVLVAQATGGGVSLSSLVTLLDSILTQGLTLVPVIVGFALLIAGGVMALGNHQRGKEAVICGLLGGAVMLVSQTIGKTM